MENLFKESFKLAIALGFLLMLVVELYASMSVVYGGV